MHFALNKYVKETSPQKPDATAGDRVLEAAAVIFEAAEMDHDGYIDRDELKQVIDKLGEELATPFTGTEEDTLLETSLARYGKDGKIDFDNFVALISSNPF